MKFLNVANKFGLIKLNFKQNFIPNFYFNQTLNNAWIFKFIFSPPSSVSPLLAFVY